MSTKRTTQFPHCCLSGFWGKVTHAFSPGTSWDGAQGHSCFCDFGLLILIEGKVLKIWIRPECHSRGFLICTKLERFFSCAHTRLVRSWPSTTMYIFWQNATGEMVKIYLMIPLGSHCHKDGLGQVYPSPNHIPDLLLSPTTTIYPAHRDCMWMNHNIGWMCHFGPLFMTLYWILFLQS